MDMQGEQEREFVEVEGWLQKTQERLYQHWVKTTGHRKDASGGTWACKIASRCTTCRDHLSIPCSLLQEGNEIGQFLNAPCYADAPTTFFRLYLIILSEFVNQLGDLSKLIGFSVGKPPSQINIWANRWAKHKLHFMVQHHPHFVFADAYADPSQDVFEWLRTHDGEDTCGNTFKLKIIDMEWLSRAGDKHPDLAEANDQRQAVVLVPPLMTFLELAIAYFREFIDDCLHQPELVKVFESQRVWLRCFSR